MDEVKVALHNSILSWLTMNSDVGVIEKDTSTILLKGKIIFVNLSNGSIFKVNMPIGSLHIDNKYIVALFIKE